MRAIVITRPGGPEVLEVQTRPRPEPASEQVRIRVHASALNRADIMQREGTYPPPPGAPADIPGMEYAGEVDLLGSAATMWKVGDRVMGIVGGGAHAEYVVAHEREVMPIPPGLTWEEAAAIPEVFLTAYDALFRRIEIQTGERLLIHAVGSGVGTAALQLARAAGVTVFGTSRSAAKLERAKELGLDVAIDSSSDDWAGQVDRITAGKGVHAILDLLGGSYLSGSLRVLASRGRLVLVGLSAGRSAELDLGLILNKRLQIVGTVLRWRPLEEKISLAREFAERALPLFETARVRPVIDHVFSFAEIGLAHDRMASNSNFGKIVLRWD
jgi:putative PIG3 family NAD(P)H quinone oxidoreductase